MSDAHQHSQLRRLAAGASSVAFGGGCSYVLLDASARRDAIDAISWSIELVDPFTAGVVLGAIVTWRTRSVVPMLVLACVVAASNLPIAAAWEALRDAFVAKNAWPALTALTTLIAGSGVWFVSSNKNRRRRRGTARIISDIFYKAQGQVVRAAITGEWWSEADDVKELLSLDRTGYLAAHASDWEWKRACSALGWLEVLESRRVQTRAQRRRLDGIIRRQDDGIRFEDRLELVRTYERLEIGRFALRRVAARVPLPFTPASVLGRLDRARRAQSAGVPIPRRFRVVLSEPAVVWCLDTVRAPWRSHEIDVYTAGWWGDKALAGFTELAQLLPGLRPDAPSPGLTRPDRAVVGLTFEQLETLISADSVLALRPDAERTLIVSERREAVNRRRRFRPGASTDTRTLLRQQRRANRRHTSPGKRTSPRKP